MFNEFQYNQLQLNKSPFQPTNTYPYPPLTSVGWLPEVINGAAVWVEEEIVNNP
jgi:hypothetical protein